MKKGAIIKYWDNVRRLTLDVLERFPDDKLSYRPIPTVRTVAEQFEHILAEEIFVRNGLMLKLWENVPSPNEACTDKGVLAEMLRREHETTSRVLRMLPPDTFGVFHETPYGQMTTEAVIYLTIDEEIHHRGNLYVYLRLLNIVPPQMVQNYGELFMEDNDG
ncbi:MAG TPA: hypothetical protein DEO84_01685 [candidate division Zixibacteria bacterium]|nr:hypothetical protein [candidate division Zixibacteria bacterium]